MEQFTKQVTGQSYGQIATATAGRIRLDAPYFSRFVVQTLGPTISVRFQIWVVAPLVRLVEKW